MHHLPPLFSKISLEVKTSYQIATECTIYRPCFQFFFSEVWNRFTYHQNAPVVSVPVFKMFSAVPYRFKHHNATFTVLVFKIVSAVPNSFKYCKNTHSILFLTYLWSSKLAFQIALEGSSLPSMFSNLSDGADSLPQALLYPPMNICKYKKYTSRQILTMCPT